MGSWDHWDEIIGMQSWGWDPVMGSLGWDPQDWILRLGSLGWDPWDEPGLGRRSPELSRAFFPTQELLPGGFWVFGLTDKHPPAEPGERGLGTPRGLQSLAGIHPHGQDCAGNVTVVSPELHGGTVPLILLCPCHSSCRKWGTAAPWCDLTSPGRVAAMGQAGRAPGPAVPKSW